MDRITTNTELRAEGRTLAGTVLRWRELSPSHRERFLPGSLRWAEPWVNIEHRQAEIVAYGDDVALEADDEALRLRAELPNTPAGDLALQGVSHGTRRGLSVEFRAAKERREPQTGVREIEDGFLFGVGIVRRPSYPGSRIAEVRRVGVRVRGSVPLGRSLPCRCRQHAEEIVIEETALDEAIAEAVEGVREIPAFFTGDFGAPVAAVGRGLRVERSGDVLNIDIDGLPETQAVRDFLASSRDGGGFYSIRPYIASQSSDEVIEGATVTVRRGDLRGIEIASISGPRGAFREIVIEEPERRRRRLWL